VLSAERVFDNMRSAGDAGNADSSRSSPLLIEDDGKYTNIIAS
jgi:hypothetical protein